MAGLRFDLAHEAQFAPRGIDFDLLGAGPPAQQMFPGFLQTPLADDVPPPILVGIGQFGRTDFAHVPQQVRRGERSIGIGPFEPRRDRHPRQVELVRLDSRQGLPRHVARDDQPFQRRPLPGVAVQQPHGRRHVPGQILQRGLPVRGIFGNEHDVEGRAVLRHDTARTVEHQTPRRMDPLEADPVLFRHVTKADPVDDLQLPETDTQHHEDEEDDRTDGPQAPPARRQRLLDRGQGHRVTHVSPRQRHARPPPAGRTRGESAAARRARPRGRGRRRTSAGPSRPKRRRAGAGWSSP